MQKEEQKLEKKINKDLILREKLALQRTVLANQTTLLAFLRTSMYFLVAGLSIRGLLDVKNGIYFEIILFNFSAWLLIFGLINYFKQKKRIQESKKHIGNYQLDYFAQDNEPKALI